MKRVWALDVLECPACHGCMRILAAIHPPDTTEKSSTISVYPPAPRHSHPLLVNSPHKPGRTGCPYHARLLQTLARGRVSRDLAHSPSIPRATREFSRHPGIFVLISPYARLNPLCAGGTRVPAAALVYVIPDMRHCWSCWQASYFTYTLCAGAPVCRQPR